MSAIMFYTLAVTAALSTLVVAILNGVVYATLQSLPNSNTMGQALLTLSVITCVALIVLSLFLHKDVRGEHQWPEWKMGLFYFTGVYLFIAATSSSAAMTTDHLSSGLRVSRSIFWALSLLAQGQYFGFLLVNSAQKTPTPTWPSSYSEQLPRSDSPSSLASPSAAHDRCPRAGGFDTRRSSLRKFPRRSNRYSGGTLCMQNTNEGKDNSFDTSSSATSSPEPSPTYDRTTGTFTERDTRPILRGDGSIRSMPSLRQDRVQHPLDRLVQTSPTTSTFHLDSPSASTLNLSEAREENIHPLFRSTSPCPSPIPTPGTVVKASPSAGQTITKNTLSRMRSNQFLRTPSPLPGSEESRSGLAPVRTGQIRRSHSTTQYEQRYELNESPEEKRL